MNNFNKNLKSTLFQEELMNKLYLKRFWGLMTSSNRLLPNFIIIGGRHCGTTSLYNYLIEHPCILPALKKEIHFFDSKFNKGLKWYKANFPKYSKSKIENNVQILTGEASPYCLFNPLAPKRIHETLPHVKLIVLLRNPIERAYSDYKQNDKETLTFDEAIKHEKNRLQGEEKKILLDSNHVSIPHWTQAYTTQGIYVEQLKNWMSIFPKHQILVLKSEDLFDNPSTILKQVHKFIGVEQLELSEYKQYNPTDKSQQMKDETRKYLEIFFKPHNERLYDYLGIRFDWK